jgi:hypothetical protein
MSNTPESPNTDMAPNGERMPAGADVIPESREQMESVEQREPGTSPATTDVGESDT